MRKGEKGIFIVIGVFAVLSMGYKMISISEQKTKDPGIPFYSSAPKALRVEATEYVRDLNCRDCHVLWSLHNIMQSVPAPSLDGIGSLRSEKWLYDYLSSPDPQSILPSRLKPEYHMPSFAKLPEKKRRVLAQFLSSLKVKDWYLKETKKREYEKLTGKKYKPVD